VRSVVIHLADTTRAAVRERLSEFAGPANGNEWRYPPASSTPVLYIGFYEDYEREFEPDELRQLQTALGKMPDVIVIANVSGRTPGDAEVRQFVECLLDTFHGVAQDEYSGHCWTLAEIRSCATIQGHSFFDYEGWFRDTKQG